MTEDKFLTAIKGYKKIGTLTFSILTILFGNNVGLDTESIQLISGACMSFIIGQGIQDNGNPKQKPPQIVKL